MSGRRVSCGRAWLVARATSVMLLIFGPAKGASYITPRQGKQIGMMALPLVTGRKSHLAWRGAIDRRGRRAIPASRSAAPLTGIPRPVRPQCQSRLRGGRPIRRRTAMREIGHFIDGREVKGTSGRHGDVFNPNTGEVQAQVAFAAPARGRAGDRGRRRGAARLGRHQPAAARARAVQVPRAGAEGDTTLSPRCSPPSTARPSPTPRATSSAGWRWSSSPAASRTC